jgi:hypothetical protein
MRKLLDLFPYSDAAALAALADFWRRNGVDSEVYQNPYHPTLGILHLTYPDPSCPDDLLEVDIDAHYSLVAVSRAERLDSLRRLLVAAREWNRAHVIDCLLAEARLQVAGEPPDFQFRFVDGVQRLLGRTKRDVASAGRGGCRPAMAPEPAEEMR